MKRLLRNHGMVCFCAEYFCVRLMLTDLRECQFSTHAKYHRVCILLWNDFY